MVKKGYVECEKCGKVMKKVAKRGHKCETLDPNRPKKCPICSKEVSTNVYSMHFKNCSTRTFWEEHKSFFLFIKNLVSKTNKESRSRYIQERRNRLRDKYCDVLFEDEELTPEERKGVLKIAEERARRKEDLDALKEAKAEGIAFSASIDIEIIKNTMKGLNAEISARQVILEYLADNKLLTEPLKNKIYLHLKGGDYPTNKELLNNQKLFAKIIQVRAMTGYKERVGRYYSMLARHFKDPSAYACPFCQKNILDVKPHIKYCEMFEDAFNDSKETVISTYLKCFNYSVYTDQEKSRYYIDYYKQYNAKYFLSTISEHIKNRLAFREKINEGKRQFAKETSLPFNPKDIVQEVNDWNPDKVLVYESDKEEDEPKDEPKEEIKPPIEEKKEPTQEDLIASMKLLINFKKKINKK